VTIGATSIDFETDTYPEADTAMFWTPLVTLSRVYEPSEPVVEETPATVTEAPDTGLKEVFATVPDTVAL